MCYETAANARTLKSIVAFMKGHGGGDFNGILLSTKGIQCLSCGRNEYGKVVLGSNSGARSYRTARNTHTILPEDGGERSFTNSPSTVSQMPRKLEQGDRAWTSRSKSPDLASQLLVGSAKLSLDDYMNKTAEMFRVQEPVNEASTSSPLQLLSEGRKPKLASSEKLEQLITERSQAERGYYDRIQQGQSAPNSARRPTAFHRKYKSFYPRELGRPETPSDLPPEEP